MKKRFLFIFLIGLFLTPVGGLVAQVNMISANPHKIDTSVQEVHGVDIALYDFSAPSRHKLIFMIEGTGASARDMYTIDSVFATMGYHVISVDYKNNVISTICEHSTNKACSYNFRKEIITGKPLSPKTEVDSVNSLLNRFRTFLQYLKKNDPDGKWGQFIEEGKPLWEDIVVAGHSQGAGHAAMLGKMFKVTRVLIFSGPQDYLVDLGMPSPWLSKPSATPENRYYAFLNLQDPFNVHYQIANCKRLMAHIQPDTMMVRPGVPIRGKQHILINNIHTKNHHGSTLFPEFKNVWAYMLGTKNKGN